MKKIIFLLAIFLATDFLSLSASADMGRVSKSEQSKHVIEKSK
jgi:hypothetical protein